MPTTIIAEIGINHNGELGIAKRLIDTCAAAGVDYVKFQKRTPELCVPDDQKNVMRETPWGAMTYLEYKKKIEFGKDEYDELAFHCFSRGIKWTASAWDIPSLDFLKGYKPDFIKIPSALITDHVFLSQVNYPLVLSTGASTIGMIDSALRAAKDWNVDGILHCTSTYPCKTEEINLSCINTLRELYPWAKIGFSNHHPGMIYMPAAVALGAEMIEFHVTLDRSMWGTDQSASIEPEGVVKLVKWIRGVEAALGDGVKRIYDSEISVMKKLRKV